MFVGDCRVWNFRLAAPTLENILDGEWKENTLQLKVHLSQRYRLPQFLRLSVHFNLNFNEFEIVDFL